ncbi:MAG: TonB-dependent receptor [Acidobacteria bacterium]|nr:TonB-dependent receptor [Acidobacteriota bacterium]
MRIVYVSLGCLLAAGLMFGQSDRGIITGTVTDPASAVVPNAPVVATNTETGVQFRTVTTGTGNYTIPSMPAGSYDLTVEVDGFRKFQQQGIRVQVAQTARIDVVLQVGATTESVTVTGDAPLLKSESAEQSTTLSGERINALPLNFAIGQGAVRNPLSFVQLSPGSSISGWNDIRVNGAPSNTFRIIFEGQDTTSALNPRVSDESQPSVEALQEFTLQTSNFAAEFGQVTGGLFNFTSRSGTNQFHGSVYEYFVNEALNAGIPFTDNGSGGLVRPRARRHDFGASIGGPVILPKLYNGRERTFFFFNFEMYRNREGRSGTFGTVPTEAYRRGDFSAALTGRVLGTDPLGRPILENTIYDPKSGRTVDGRVIRDPYPGNVIPQSHFDPVAAKIQSLIAAPMNAGLVNNFEQRFEFRKIQDIPSVKIDHNFSTAGKLSFYWSRMRTDKDNGQDGLPDPISQRRDQFIRSHTERVNYDHSLSPTVLLHLGAGYQRYHNPDTAPPNILAYDTIQELGLKGAVEKGFPRMTGLGTAQGGLGFNLGPSNRNLYLQDKVTGVASISMTRSNHTYKAGAEYRFDNFTNRNTNLASGNYAFSAVETGLPATQGQNLQGGSIGFPYASFLLGLVNNATIGNPQDPQYRKTAWAFFGQDTWKVTRRLTLDYGIRWDIEPAAHELRYRTSMFAPTTPNPSAGGLLGATLYEGDGAERCNCRFTDTYLFGFGPRLGAAYQVTPRTVLRVGWGITYGSTANFNYIGGGNSLGMGFNSISFTTPSFGDPAVVLRDGLTYNLADLYMATYDVGIRPSRGQLNSPPAHVDRNGGRPPRVNQWNIGLQQEVTRNLVVEAAYVGNRGAWFQASGLVDLNALTPERIRQASLDINNAADRTLLTSRIDSPQAQARGFRPPYAGFPAGATVAQTLRPFPQFGGLGMLWAPLGNTWYDSLQVKVTKRYSLGLDFTAAYTWSKNLTTVEDQNAEVVPVNDVFNRRNQKTFSRTDQPHVFVTSFNYRLPAYGMASRNRWTRQLLSGWTIGGILRYASGTPIRVPAAQNNLAALLFRGTFANRVPGQPLFLKELNCQCIDPKRDFVLNPAAWSDPGPGQWGFAPAYYGDYRYQRRHDEQFSIGKVFAIRERTNFQVRAEFFNIFNRTYLNNPDATNALATQRTDARGVPISGFGRINAGSVFLPPRSGQIVARLEF